MWSDIWQVNSRRSMSVSTSHLNWKERLTLCRWAQLNGICLTSVVLFVFGQFVVILWILFLCCFKAVTSVQPTVIFCHLAFNVVLQPLLVWKCILLTSLPTVGVSDFTAGIQLAKRSLEVFVMATSKFCFHSTSSSFCSSFVERALIVVRDYGWSLAFDFDCSALCSCDAVYMDSVPLLCLMLLQGWRTRMFQRGTVISAGEEMWQDILMLIPGMHSHLLSSAQSSCVDWLTCAGSVRTSQLYFVETRWMWRTGRWKQNRSLSTGRKTYNTTRSQQKATIILKNPSCTLPGNLLGMLSIAAT